MMLPYYLLLLGCVLNFIYALFALSLFFFGKTLPYSMSKIFIAVPSSEQVAAEFAQCMALATGYLVSQGHTVNVGVNIGSYIGKNRRELVQYFLGTDFEYIWWLDYDMTFPLDTCVQLLKHDAPIVGCNYRKRRFPNPIFVAHKCPNKSIIEGGVSVELSDESPETEIVDVVGHGCCLVKREVYEKIGEPYYIMDYNKKKKLEIGEDIFFFQNVKNAGYEVLCDNVVSRQVSHIGVFHFRYDLSY